MFTQEPPPPRYVLQISTGKWRRQTASPVLGASTGAENLQNSLDYFLRRAMYAPVSPVKDNSNSQQLPVEVLKQIEEFEKRHCGEPSRRFSLTSTFVEVNPIIGLLCGVPLYDLYDTLTQRKGSAWQRQQHQGASGVALRLNLEELCDVCAQLVPNMVSCEYAQQMLSSVPGYREDDTVLLSSFFSFIVEHAFHPAMDRNVRALFRAFDPENTGVISVATLSPAVVSAWAELNLFGNLRGEWDKMAAALELANGLDLSIVDGATLLTPESTRAVLCASSILYNAMNSVDMDGSHLKPSP
ncbi:hypothetical protein DQ04_03191010 [Trypanosoma grayi]|uniref:hypothetical protein n=1 Tax=Trypanosoma grayi TaxID=71804 RepID=UPI0004F44FF7|nr:hypothetical protein DQ04_03191010 [Trypanosoma grayi]KEG10877.1 hypothetical protein DQ04_03191010 [Trypanosoma grayi]